MWFCGITTSSIGVAVVYLVDTNVFLEVLLKQDKSEQCKIFLNNNISKLTVSDFSLHSIGVILFRKKNELIFQQFISDVIPKINIATLPTKHYYDLVHKPNLDWTLMMRINFTLPKATT